MKKKGELLQKTESANFASFDERLVTTDRLYIFDRSVGRAKTTLPIFLRTVFVQHDMRFHTSYDLLS